MGYLIRIIFKLDKKFYYRREKYAILPNMKEEMEVHERLTYGGYQKFSTGKRTTGKGAG